MSTENRLQELGLELPIGISAAAKYVPAVLHRNTLYLSGQIPRIGEVVAFTGRVGADSTADEASQAARVCVQRLLAAARDVLGSLDRVERVLEVTVYVNADESFTEPSAVADAASEMLLQVFQGAGHHARSAVCVAQLPKNATVEVSAIFAVRSASD